MHLSRLRRLAGLTETITDDPHVNAEIERKLALQHRGVRDLMLDILEIVYNSGQQGVTQEQIVSQLSMIHAHDPNVQDALKSTGGFVDQVISDLVAPDKFGQFVQRNGNRFVWKQPTQNDMNLDTDVDPMTRAAVSSQVGLTSEALAFMRANSPFTEASLARHLTQQGIPGFAATQMANHVINQFQSMLEPVAGGYAIKSERPASRDDTMQLFRDLEANARNRSK